MDPTAAAIASFQKTFRAFQCDAQARVLRVQASLQDASVVARVLRGEEWRPQNRSPFVIFDQAFDDEHATLETMRLALREHCMLVERGLIDDGCSIRPLTAAAPSDSEPRDSLASLAVELRRFVECTSAVLTPPLVCWLPATVKSPDLWEQSVLRLTGLLNGTDIRMVIASDSTRLDERLQAVGISQRSVAFFIDEKDATAAAIEMLAAVERGGVLGLGAGPDVAPPPRRPKSRQPESDEIRAAVRGAGLPPVLTVDQGAELRRRLSVAAKAVNEGRADAAIEEQRRAVDLCAQAGVGLEQALMMMVLGSYHLAVGRAADAAHEYGEAAAFAESIEAWAQASQSYLARGFVLLQNGEAIEAATAYEAAATMASKAESAMLTIEAARMAGRCWRQAGRIDRAIVCWRAGIAAADGATASEVRLSSLLDLSDEFIAVLAEQGRRHEASEAEAAIAAIAAKFGA